jgi:parallel beta-helix repeat protein
MRSLLYKIPLYLMLCAAVSPAFSEDRPAARQPLAGRMESNWKLGSERSLLMNEFWIPVVQNVEDGSVVYADLRMMADDQENREFNIGIGYRKMILETLIGRGIAGTHIWLDRRYTERGSAFNQVTAGAEWYADDWELKLNAYLPLNDSHSYGEGTSGATGSGSFAGTQIIFQGGGQGIIEEALAGVDIELGYKLPLPEGITDSTRIYGGLYHFEGDESNDVSGWRARIASDITSDIQLGARFQSDDERGSQGFLEAAVRLPFGHKKSYQTEGLRARLDESPERDVDIVTNEAVSGSGNGGTIPLLNTATGTIQTVIHVDNTAAGGGDGSAENPFNTLAAAQAVASMNDLIYVHRGDGTSTGQNAGITIDDDGQMLIGEGSAITSSDGLFTIAGGGSLPAVIIPAGTAPVISNTNPNSDGVTVTADNVYLTGFTVDGAARDGIVVEGDAASAQNVTISNVTATNNRMGIYIHGTNGGDVSAMIEQSVTTANSQHGIAVYDDTAGTFEVDLGGGSLGSAGLNVLAGNTLEDLAVEYDGRALSAQNNWWGQAGGPDLDDPSDGFRPQIYYGAPINDDLAANWDFDTEWTTNATAYDRSANANNGTLNNLSLADQVAGQNGEALDFTPGPQTEILVSDSASLDISGTQITLAAWVRPQNLSSGTDEVLFGKAWTNGAFVSPYYQYGFEIDTNGGDSFDFIFGDTGSGFHYLQMTNLPAVQDVWQHVAFTYDGANVRGYINGVQRQVWAETGSIQARSDLLRIGSDFQSNQHLDSQLDDVRIYDRTLTAAEIFGLYQMDTTSTTDVSGSLSAAP